jgi:hypothetical protein
VTNSDGYVVAADQPESLLTGYVEVDDDTAYFYLYDGSLPVENRILRALRMWTGPSPVTEPEIDVRWNVPGTAVGVFIRGVLWGVLDDGAAYGGHYMANALPEIPRNIAATFDPSYQ